VSRLQIVYNRWQEHKTKLQIAQKGWSFRRDITRSEHLPGKNSIAIIMMVIENNDCLPMVRAFRKAQQTGFAFRPFLVPRECPSEQRGSYGLDKNPAVIIRIKEERVDERHEG
jgi:hypothetical protein